MATKKDKTTSGHSSTDLFRKSVADHTNAPGPGYKKTAENNQISRYFLFDDEDDFTTLGRDISEFVPSKKATGTPDKT